MKTLYRLLLDFFDGIDSVCMKIDDWAFQRRTWARKCWIKCGGLDGIKER